MAGVGMGLLRYDGKVESVVVQDDAVLVLCIRGRACNAQKTYVPTKRCRISRLLGSAEYQDSKSTTADIRRATLAALRTSRCIGCKESK